MHKLWESLGENDKLACQTTEIGNQNLSYTNQSDSKAPQMLTPLPG